MEEIEQKSFIKGVIGTIVGALKYIVLSIVFAAGLVEFNSVIFGTPIALGEFLLSWIVSFVVVLRRF